MSEGHQKGRTGESFLDSITTVLKDSEGDTYEAGTDCGVEAKNLDTGKEAGAIVDAGIYELTVTPKTFAFDSTSETRSSSWLRSLASISLSPMSIRWGATLMNIPVIS